MQAIVAFSAVGSLREEIAPGHFVIPDQIIDRTKGIRADTFFRGDGVVVHSMFGDPFSNKLNKFVAPRVADILANSGVKVHTGKTVVCMEGECRERSEGPMSREWSSEEGVDGRDGQPAQTCHAWSSSATPRTRPPRPRCPTR